MRREHAILPIAIVLFGSFFFFNVSLAKVLISRIQIGGVSTTDEYVELYNYSSSSRSLSKWSLSKKTSGGNSSYLVSSFPETAIISPFSYFLVAHRDFSPSSTITPDLFYTNNSASLAANNQILLVTDLETLEDEVGWGSVTTSVGFPATNPAPLKQLARLPDTELGNYIDSDDSSADLFETDSFPRNSFSLARPFTEYLVSADTPSSTASSTQQFVNISTDWSVIKINEIVSNPESGNEWVELYNSSSTTVDLTGGKICDSRDPDSCNIYSFENSTMPPGWKIFEIDGSKLNNDGDSVILISSVGNVVDRVDYDSNSSPRKGESLAREMDGEGDWKISTTITPNEKNIVNERVENHPATIFSGGGGGGSYTEPNQVSKKSKSKTTTETEVAISWNVTVPKTTTVNSSTYFDAFHSFDPRGGDILYSWNFGDGTTLDGSRVFHSFASSGIYSVTVSATSSQGTLGSKTLQMRVLNNFYPKNTVYIDSVLPRPDSNEDEWVAISGFTTGTIDLSGWMLSTESGKSYTFPIKTVFKPYSILKFYKPITKLQLTDDGDTILLSNKEGEVIDVFHYDKTKRSEIVSSASGTLANDNTETTSTFKIAKAKNITNSKRLSLVSGYTIDQIRKLTSKKYIYLTGTAISIPGKPYANNFYLADDSAGIQIYSYKKIFPKINIGDQLSVNGELSEASGVPRIKISSASQIKIISSNSSVLPTIKPIDEVDESDMGKLATLTGEVTDILSSSFFLDDSTSEATISIPSGSDINKKILTVGKTFSVTGIIEKNKTGWKLFPRSNNDLKLISAKPETSNTISNNTKTALGIGGGVIIIGLAAFLKLWILKK